MAARRRGGSGEPRYVPVLLDKSLLAKLGHLCVYFGDGLLPVTAAQAIRMAIDFTSDAVRSGVGPQDDEKKTA